MKNLNKAGVGLALLTTALGATVAHAQTFYSTTVTDNGSATAPTGVISQLDSTGTVTDADFTDKPTPGQSFFTPSTGLNLTGITVQTNGNLGLNQGSNIDLRITMVNADGSLTNVAAVYANVEPIRFAKANDYFTFDMTPAGVTLIAGKTYAYDIRTLGGYLGLTHSTSDVYAGGTAFDGTDGARTFGTSAPTPLSYDRVFVISGTPVVAAPEPSQFAVFGLGLMGLGALALRARKKAVTA